ncbi:JmjC domain-containing protein [Paracoccus benzoatiresistens]|uniref:Cupin domain-containing protein n=1 Tax=Paracoccus benzoatiresistens TaxID=2997341 RepID=A0ABT4J9C1_9RHOB|nr:cupin domain-containing protein [Paracoccus sp. EF6]MCZ0963504.1 cupin domain-containing protein [Paracoccus sp. EF6]
MVTVSRLIGETASFNERFWGRECLKLSGTFQPLDVWNLEQFWNAILGPGTIDQARVRISGIENGVETQKLAQDAFEVRRALGRGLGVTINRLERALPPGHPLVVLHADFAEKCGCSSNDIQIASFLTPPGGQNFEWHRDRDHVFTLQIEGDKLWDVIGGDQVEREFHLIPGNFLYVPYGMPHRVRAASQESLSVAIIVRAPAFRDVVVEAILTMMDRSAEPLLSGLRPLPLGWTSTADQLMPSGLSDAVEGVMRPPDWKTELMEAANSIALQAFPGMPVSQSLATALSVRSPVHLSSVLGRLDPVGMRIGESSRGVAAAVPGRPQLQGPAELGPALKFLKNQVAFKVSDLPSSYEDDTKVMIARRLVDAGFFKLLDPP